MVAASGRAPAFGQTEQLIERHENGAVKILTALTFDRRGARQRGTHDRVQRVVLCFQKHGKRGAEAAERSGQRVIQTVRIGNVPQLLRSIHIPFHEIPSANLAVKAKHTVGSVGRGCSAVSARVGMVRGKHIQNVLVVVLVAQITSIRSAAGKKVAVEELVPDTVLFVLGVSGRVDIIGIAGIPIEVVRHDRDRRCQQVGDQNAQIDIQCCDIKVDMIAAARRKAVGAVKRAVVAHGRDQIIDHRIELLQRKVLQRSAIEQLQDHVDQIFAQVFDLVDLCGSRRALRTVFEITVAVDIISAGVAVAVDVLIVIFPLAEEGNRFAGLGIFGGQETVKQVRHIFGKQHGVKVFDGAVHQIVNVVRFQQTDLVGDGRDLADVESADAPDPEIRILRTTGENVCHNRIVAADHGSFIVDQRVAKVSPVGLEIKRIIIVLAYALRLGVQLCKARPGLVAHGVVVIDHAAAAVVRFVKGVFNGQKHTAVKRRRTRRKIGDAVFQRVISVQHGVVVPEGDLVVR